MEVDPWLDTSGFFQRLLSVLRPDGASRRMNHDDMVLDFTMKQKTALILTLLLCGRAMTLAFILRAGGAHPGDPPAAWLMPLVGDAVIGITGLFIAFLIVRKTGLWVLTAIVVWNVVAIRDALSAFIVHTTNPWPDFFMVRMFGPSMFLAAAAMHLAIVILVSQRDLRTQYIH